ncbi:copper amine oxidase-like protein [Paenibacillus taihuensis]|uniref:Copper amine oxidase-like protein n=1 Tax=Paenibacillus taihuensis TaxID=1156355 RepID=A0A3D9SCZ9_9BACL|nr:stalk domain-containing protein [Paenibacillus taihuensis]REE92742.1 copper amine oxidase-like protein [Paenibacillus taihuensis]
MKWFICICLLLMLAAPASAAAADKQQQGLTLTIDGTAISASPIIQNNNVYLPLRAAMEHFGATVSFSGQHIVIHRSGIELSMELGQSVVTINGERVTVTTPPILVKGITFVPIRFIANAFGYDVLYQPSAHQVLLRTPGEQAVLYGYAVDLDGAAVKDGYVKLVNTDSGETLEATLRNAFYRISVALGSYKFVSYLPSAGDLEQKVAQVEPLQVKAGQTVFTKLSPSQSGLKVTLHDPNGVPIARASATFYTSHGSVSVTIRGGIGYLDFYEQGSYIFNYLTIESGVYDNYDIYHPFTISEDGTVSSLDLIAHRPNVTGQVASESKEIYGNFSGCSIGENGEQESCFVEGAPGGAYSFYLPDGQYQWSSYYDSTTRQQFIIDRNFTISSDQLQTDLTWTKPVVNIHGTASSNEGGPLTGGYINFYGNNQEYSAWVLDGKFDCYLPDGTYSVRYDQFFDTGFSVKYSQSVTVMDGKLSIAPDFQFYLS